MPDDDQPITWRDYIDMRFLALSEARDLARDNIERRLEEMNQFRDENRRTSALNVHRDLHQADIDRLEALIAIEREARQRSEGVVATWRFLVVLLGFPGIVALMLAIYAVFGPR